MDKDEYLWVEKYRPKRLSDTILPPDLKETFQKFVDQKNIPNLILSGPPGIGKTTVAKAMLDELECDYIVINGSLNAGIDVLRTDIAAFASSVSFSGGRKYVILDEADFLNPNSVQPALRNFIEEFSKNTGFIFTCNYKNKILDALHSRCSVIDFKLEGKIKMKLAAAFHVRACEILAKEGVEYDKSVVAEVIKRWVPDWRRILNELQRYSVKGKIDSGILGSFNNETYNELVKYLKEKNFTEVRKWVAQNLDLSPTEFYEHIYHFLSDHLTTNGQAQLILIIAKYAYQQAFVASTEINVTACLTEIMIEAEWKG